MTPCRLSRLPSRARRERQAQAHCHDGGRRRRRHRQPEGCHMNAWQKKPFERAKNHLCHFLHTTPLFFCPLPLISPLLPVHRFRLSVGDGIWFKRGVARSIECWRRTIWPFGARTFDLPVETCLISNDDQQVHAKGRKRRRANGKFVS